MDVGYDVEKEQQDHNHDVANQVRDEIFSVLTDISVNRAEIVFSGMIGIIFMVTKIIFIMI